MKIRICNENDKIQWVRLNKEFMDFEIKDAEFWNNTNNASIEKFEVTFEQALLHPELITLLIIETDEGESIGFANLMTIFSIWAHGKALILDDLYIVPERRGSGMGRCVLKYVEDFAMANGYKRFQFLSESHNEKAYEFYTALGYGSEDMKFYVKYF